MPWLLEGSPVAGEAARVRFWPADRGRGGERGTYWRSRRSARSSANSSGATGVASYQYRIKPKEPVGAWRVQAVATFNGIIGSGWTSFAVH